MRFHALTMSNMKMMVLYVAWCSLVEIGSCFRGTCCHHIIRDIVVECAPGFIIFLQVPSRGVEKTSCYESTNLSCYLLITLAWGTVLSYLYYLYNKCRNLEMEMNKALSMSKTLVTSCYQTTWHNIPEYNYLQK